MDLPQDPDLFLRLDVCEAAHTWMIEYNEHRPHDTLGDRTSAECRPGSPESSTFELST
jgi:hypothetical protein